MKIPFETNPSLNNEKDQISLFITFFILQKYIIHLNNKLSPKNDSSINDNKVIHKMFQNCITYIQDLLLSTTT